MMSQDRFCTVVTSTQFTKPTITPLSDAFKNSTSAPKALPKQHKLILYLACGFLFRELWLFRKHKHDSSVPRELFTHNFLRRILAIKVEHLVYTSSTFQMLYISATSTTKTTASSAYVQLDLPLSRNSSIINTRRRLFRSSSILHT